MMIIMRFALLMNVFGQIYKNAKIFFTSKGYLLGL